MFNQQYYVVYHHAQIISGPLDRHTAKCIAEDLDMALMDPGYEAVNSREYKKIVNGPNFLARLWDRLHHRQAEHHVQLPKAA